MKKALLFVAVLALAFSALATSLRCSIDDTGLYFTGRTNVASNGKMLWEHRCYGYPTHSYWLTTEQKNQ